MGADRDWSALGEGLCRYHWRGLVRVPVGGHYLDEVAGPGWVGRKRFVSSSCSEGMTVDRRRLVAASGVALAGLAGCSSMPGGESNGDGDGGGGGGTSGEPLELDFGEGAVFRNDEDVRLEVGMANPRLVETVPVVQDGEIAVDSPESKPFFLFVDVRVSNQGSSSIEPPSGLYFEADGESVEREFVRTPGRKYRDVGELASGERVAATIAFAAPGDAETGAVSLEFQTLLDSPPARWTFDFADVERESRDLTRSGLGEPFRIETGQYGYEFTPTAARETTTYTDDDGTEHAASAESKWVLVEATAENVGEEPVNLPNPYDVRLAADGSVSRGTQYATADGRYAGQVDPYSSGATQSGSLLFEVAESASSYTLRLAIGNETFVTWSVDPSDA
jgi:hypothetical protein